MSDPTPHSALAVQTALVERLIAAVENLDETVDGLRDDLTGLRVDVASQGGRIGTLEAFRAAKQSRAAEAPRLVIPGWVWHSITAAIASTVSALVTAHSVAPSNQPSSAPIVQEHHP